MVPRGRGWSRASCSSSAAGHTDEPDAPFDMTAFVLRHAVGANAVEQAARGDGDRDLAGAGRPPDRRHHERRPRADLAGPPGATARAARDRGAARRRPQRPGAAGHAGVARSRRAVERAPAAETRAGRVPRGAPGAAVRPPRRVARGPAVRARPARSRCAHDRVRAPVCDLQARGAPVHATRDAWPASSRPRIGRFRS